MITALVVPLLLLLSSFYLVSSLSSQDNYERKEDDTMRMPPWKRTSPCISASTASKSYKQTKIVYYDAIPEKAKKPYLGSFVLIKK